MKRTYLLKPEIAKLREMLRFIVENTEETYVSLASLWGMEVQYIYDFNDIKNQKNKGNRRWFDQVRAYYLELLKDIREAELLDAVEDGEEADQGGDQLVKIKLDMGLDEKILRADAERISGHYRCYVLVETDKVALTWLELYDKRKRPLPAFTAWRPDAEGEKRTFSGYYYMYEGILYLVGHRKGSAYPWNMIAVPRQRGDETDFLAELSASTNRHAAIMTRCYLERITSEEAERFRQNPDNELGERSLPEACEKMPELKLLMGKDALHRIDRPASMV